MDQYLKQSNDESEFLLAVFNGKCYKWNKNGHKDTNLANHQPGGYTK